MDANLIIEKMKEVQVALEQSAANHNALLGKMSGFQELLNSMAQDMAEPMNDESLSEEHS